ncbi:hypothetical protein PILCRDRAFT_822642 [Piloderma croceum F 1598]|uniref:Uncharacterized protein n=1 Tax=Piloderma croceum (strain F 1598) TaxID=765440 RepID=A0A0C3BS52_PILCF|nr:hypothetical protein PILCRDRAFT_822642 [Piloderma croceum F 1598]
MLAYRAYIRLLSTLGYSVLAPSFVLHIYLYGILYIMGYCNLHVRIAPATMSGHQLHTAVSEPPRSSPKDGQYWW